MEHVKPHVSFEVEKVIGVSCDGNVRTYQVQWSPVWVSSFHLVGCEHLIQEFIQRTTATTTAAATTTATTTTTTATTTKTTTTEKQQHKAAPDASVEDKCNSAIYERNLEPENEDISILETAVEMPVEPEKMSQPELKTEDYETNISTTSALQYEESYDENDLNEQSTYQAGDELENVGEIHSGEYTDVKMEEEEESSVGNTPTHFSSLECYDEEPNLDASVHVPQNSFTNSENPDEISSHLDDGGRKMYTCPHCDHSSLRKTDMEKHIRKHSGVKPYVCEICNRAFADISSRKRHIRSVHTEPENRTYACHLCHKSYGDNGALKKHIRKHTRPYKCDVCEELFTERCHLAKHRRVHDAVQLHNENLAV